MSEFQHRWIAILKGERPLDWLAPNELHRIGVELDRLRAENARLASDIEGLMKEFKACHEAIGLSMASSEPLSCFLQRHREALEKARIALKGGVRHLDAWGPSPVDRFWIAEAQEVLRHIDEVLK